MVDFEPPEEEENGIPMLYIIFMISLLTWGSYYFWTYSGNFSSGRDTVAIEALSKESEK